MGIPSRIATASSLAVLALACGLIGSGAPAASGMFTQANGLKDLTIDEKPRTVVSMTVEELLQNYPKELGDLEFNLDQGGLDSLLRKVGERVEAFFRDFSNTSARELVRLERFGFDGRVEDSTKQDFNYMILVHPEKAGIFFEEDRTDDKGQAINLRRLSGYILSSGYAGLCLFLHPRHHFGSRFRYLGKQTSEPFADVIAFAQKPEAGDFLAGYSDKDSPKPTPQLFQGIVWVDPGSYQIVRMRTDLLAPDIQLSLMRHTTDIQLSEVRFDDIPQPFWLPREVMVTWRLAGRTFRNWHRYSDYKLFTIQSYDKVGQPQIKQ